MTLLPLQASVVKTAVFNGANVALATKTLPATWKLKVTNLPAACRAGFQLQLSVDTPTPFATTNYECGYLDFLGPITVDTPVERDLHDYDMKFLSAFIGTTNANGRVALTQIQGSGFTITYDSQLTQN